MFVLKINKNTMNEKNVIMCAYLLTGQIISFHNAFVQSFCQLSSDRVIIDARLLYSIFQSILMKCISVLEISSENYSKFYYQIISY